MAENLKGVSFFVSPKYIGKVTRKVTTVFDSTSTERAENDDLVSWLDKNTFGSNSLYEFHGVNGLYCRIETQETETGDVQKIKNQISEGKESVPRQYVRVVRVTYQPVTINCLPTELTGSLLRRGYIPKRLEDELVKKTFE